MPNLRNSTKPLTENEYNISLDERGISCSEVKKGDNVTKSIFIALLQAYDEQQAQINESIREIKRLKNAYRRIKKEQDKA